MTFNCRFDAASRCAFEITGELTDDDTGPDDIVGLFSVPLELFGTQFTPFAVYPFDYGIHAVPFDGRDDGNGASTLHLRIEKVCDIVESDSNDCTSRP